MSNIPVSKVERTASHPAWTPVSVDGTARSPARWQAVSSHSASAWPTRTLAGLTFLGDSGQMITISGYNTAATIEDHTGDGDSAVQMRDGQSRSARHSATLLHRSGRMGVAGEVPPDGVSGSPTSAR